MRLAAVAIHPAPYRDHVFARLAALADVDLRVFYSPDVPPWRVAALPSFAEVVGKGPNALFQGSYMFRYLGSGIFRALSEFRPEAVLCYGYDRWPMQGAIGWAFLNGVPLLVRNDANAMARAGLGKRARRWGMGNLLRLFGARALAIGAANAAYWEGQMRLPPSHIHWAPYTVDNDFFDREAAEAARSGRREALRRGWGAEGKHVFLFVARLAPEKSAGLLLSAYARLRARREDAALVFVGRGPERAALERAVTERGIPGVVFAGFVEQGELPAYYAAADTFVLPSCWEPWGLVVNEAMASGLPVVASDRVGAWPDLVRQGVNGYVFPSGDESALAGALEGCMRALPGEMGRFSRAIVRGRYGVETEVQGIREALRAFRESGAAG